MDVDAKTLKKKKTVVMLPMREINWTSRSMSGVVIPPELVDLFGSAKKSDREDRWRYLELNKVPDDHSTTTSVW